MVLTVFHVLASNSPNKLIDAINNTILFLLMASNIVWCLILIIGASLKAGQFLGIGKENKKKWSNHSNNN